MEDELNFDPGALERFKDEPFQHITQIEDGAYLGDPRVVEALVRNTIADILQMRIDAQDPDKPFDEARARDRVQRTVDILLGRANAFTQISEGWNSEDGGIVEAVRRDYGVEIGTPDDTLAYALMTVLAATDSARIEESEGRDWEHLVDGAIDSVVQTLTGQTELHERD